MAEEIAIGAGTALRVIALSDEALELEETYAGGGQPPPAHLHPEQDERFEVIAGAMRVRIEGREDVLATGEVLDVPRGATHQMWNEGHEPAVLRWTTIPAGRTLDFFRDVEAIQRGEPRIEPAALLDEYSDTFQLAG